MRNTRCSCQISTKLEFFGADSRKILRYQSSWTSVQWEPSFSRADRRTSDRHDEANGRFSRFGERVLTWLQGRIYERLLCCRYDQLNCVTQCTFIFFYIQGSVHREIYANNCPTRCNYIQFIYTCKPLYMFQVVSPPIIRSSCHCIYSIWH